MKMKMPIRTQKRTNSAFTLTDPKSVVHENGAVIGVI
jgi:hypothetical protein